MRSYPSSVGKILVIDNGTKHLSELTKCLAGYSYDVIQFGEIRSENESDYDLIILTGGSSYSIVHHEYLYSNELDLIKNSMIPVIGICLGCELIAFAFGAGLTYLETPAEGFHYIDIIAKYRSLLNTSRLQVYESHRWAIKTLPDSLEALAISEDGVEILKHKTEPVYGFQFHPEITEIASNLGILRLLIASIIK